MNRLQREMNQLFYDFPTSRVRTVQSYPAINIWSVENSAIITTEIPGIKEVGS